VRYVGAEEIEDDGEAFEEKMLFLTQKLEEQFKESERLKKVIRVLRIRQELSLQKNYIKRNYCYI
jgi:hypothetical protein